MIMNKKGKNHPLYGTHRSEETKRKISESGKGRRHTEESKRKISEALKGRHHTEESKQKMSKALKGKYTGKKNSRYGKHHTEETKCKISESSKSSLQETRRKISEALKNPSEETRRKMSKAQKGLRTGEKHPFWGKHRSAETRRRISESHKGKHPTEETLHKLRNLWKDPEFVSKMKKAFSVFPNSYEEKIIELCFTHQLGFDYVGDYQKTINGKFPDFINENKNQIIETYTIYWKIKNYGSELKFRKQRQKDIAGYEIIYLNDLDINADNWRERCLFKIKNHKLCEHPKYWDNSKYESETIEKNLNKLSNKPPIQNTKYP